MDGLGEGGQNNTNQLTWRSTYNTYLYCIFVLIRIIKIHHLYYWIIRPPIHDPPSVRYPPKVSLTTVHTPCRGGPGGEGGGMPRSYLWLYVLPPHNNTWNAFPCCSPQVKPILLAYLARAGVRGRVWYFLTILRGHILVSCVGYLGSDNWSIE